MLPPNIDVITGAAVAVGINTQMNTPSATVWSKGDISR